MKLGLLWDLDGTLVDSAGDIVLTVNEMLTAFELPELPIHTVSAHIGDGAGSLIDGCVRSAGGEPNAAQVAWFMARYRAFPCRLATLYPGIAELLAAVTVPQGVVTNKPEAVSDALLRALFVRGHFGALIGGDTLAVRKPDPAPMRQAMAILGVDQAVMIGDGPHDVHGGHRAGVRVFGVDWGIGRPEGADRRFGSVAELREALADLGACRYR